MENNMENNMQTVMENNMEDNKEKKKKKKFIIILIIILALITIACVTTVIVVLMDRNQPTILSPDYAPQDEDPNAEKIPGDNGDKLDQPEGGGAVSLIYTTDVTVDLSDQKATLLFGNPQKSNQDMVVQIMVKDQVIVQSGRLTPGYRVTTLDLLEDAPEIGAGKYKSENCKFVVLYYDKDSGEKAILNTEIPITVTVQE
jgi:flagellar basal body-associated protein FliL